MFFCLISHSLKKRKQIFFISDSLIWSQDYWSVFQQFRNKSLQLMRWLIEMRQTDFFILVVFFVSNNFAVDGQNNNKNLLGHRFFYDPKNIKKSIGLKFFLRGLCSSLFFHFLINDEDYRTFKKPFQIGIKKVSVNKKQDVQLCKRCIQAYFLAPSRAL